MSWFFKRFEYDSKYAKKLIDSKNERLELCKSFKESVKNGLLDPETKRPFLSNIKKYNAYYDRLRGEYSNEYAIQEEFMMFFDHSIGQYWAIVASWSNKYYQADMNEFIKTLNISDSLRMVLLEENREVVDYKNLPILTRFFRHIF